MQRVCRIHNLKGPSENQVDDMGEPASPEWMGGGDLALADSEDSFGCSGSGSGCFFPYGDWINGQSMSFEDRSILNQLISSAEPQQAAPSLRGRLPEQAFNGAQPAQDTQNRHRLEFVTARTPTTAWTRDQGNFAFQSAQELVPRTAEHNFGEERSPRHSALEVPVPVPLGDQPRHGSMMFDMLFEPEEYGSIQILSADEIEQSRRQEEASRSNTSGNMQIT